MKISIWYILGMISFGFLIGFLVGALNTPVVGAVIAGLIPVITTLITLFNKGKSHSKDEVNKSDGIVSSRFIGATILSLSIFILIGLFSGEYHRRFDLLSSFKKEKKMPLSHIETVSSKKDSIRSLGQAFFFIGAYEYLNRLGYSDSEINKLLHMNLKYDEYDLDILVELIEGIELKEDVQGYEAPID
ncbi:MAG: hypothetical protein AAF901_07585 [Bacteroidota bacterium]